MEINKLYCIDNVEGMRSLPENFVDLTVTSPPYDGLRKYNGYSFDFENVAKQLFRITKEGGVVVWVVGDETKNGSESGTSFRQALYFKEIGFNLHDTMIWEKSTFSNPSNNRYHQVFEYMFVFSKGKPKTFNPIKDRKNIYFGTKIHGTTRLKNGKTISLSSKTKKKEISEFGQRYNVWKISEEKVLNKLHPAVFPQSIANDHILSWSNEGDLVFDPFVGSGTTAKMAKLLGRNYLGFDISQEYIDIANKRVNE